MIPVPFSDLISNKKRPVMVLSNDNHNAHTEDLIVVAITSNIRGTSNEIVFDSENMQDGKVPRISCIRPDKIYTLSRKIISKKYGTIDSDKVM